MGGEVGTKFVKDFGASTSVHGLNYIINADKIFDRYINKIFDR